MGKKKSKKPSTAGVTVANDSTMDIVQDCGAIEPDATRELFAKSDPQYSNSANAESEDQKAEASMTRAFHSLGLPETQFPVSRAKQWPYLVPYEGPWCQGITLDQLARYAHNNYRCPRPRPVEPGVLFDLLKIRKLVDEATNLAVHAHSGVPPPPASIVPRSRLDPYLLYGVPPQQTGREVTLSRERRHRLRKEAVQKLAQAYEIDENGATTAIVFGSDLLRDVPKLVLDREENADAAYVHFFLESVDIKHLQSLFNKQTYFDQPHSLLSGLHVWRTKATWTICVGKQLEALEHYDTAMSLYELQRRAPPTSMVEPSEESDCIQTSFLFKGGRYAPRVQEEDQPNGFKLQLLVNRGAAYLTQSCNMVCRTLNKEDDINVATDATKDSEGASVPVNEYHVRLRELAKRALKDFMTFLSHIEYSPGIIGNDSARLLNLADDQKPRDPCSRAKRLILAGEPSLYSRTPRYSLQSEAIAEYEKRRKASEIVNMPFITKPAVYTIDKLFSGAVLSELPPYPSSVLEGHERDEVQRLIPEFSEAVTFHPLLSEAMHSVLLCHCLLQTSKAELLRHAYMAARLQRNCDAAPFFKDEGSRGRSDWFDLIRDTNNFVGLEQDWNILCARSTAPGDEDFVDHSVAEAEHYHMGIRKEYMGRRAEQLTLWVLHGPPPSRAVLKKKGKGKGKKKASVEDEGVEE